MNWDTKFGEHFGLLRGISSFQIFCFKRDHPGQCFVKTHPDYNFQQRSLFKNDANQVVPNSLLPPLLTRLGMKPEKKVLFYNSYVPHIPITRNDLRNQWFYVAPTEAEKTVAKAAKNVRGEGRKKLADYSSLEAAQSARQRLLEQQQQALVAPTRPILSQTETQSGIANPNTTSDVSSAAPASINLSTSSPLHLPSQIQSYLIFQIPSKQQLKVHKSQRGNTINQRSRDRKRKCGKIISLS